MKDQFKINQEDCYSKLSLMAFDYQTAGDRGKHQDLSFLKQALKLIAQNAQKIL